MSDNPEMYTEQFMPLVFNDTIDTSNMVNVLLIDSTIADKQVFYDSVNANTFPIIYDSTSKTDDLLALFRQKFPASYIQRVSLVFHGRGGNFTAPFMNKKQLFEEGDLVENQSSFTENVSFLINCIKEFHVGHIDFLACNTLQYSIWQSYYSLLTSQTAVVVGASNDSTGNMQYGGNWVMESTGQDIQQIYFTDSIDYYKYLLDTITLGQIIYTYTPGAGNTASVTGSSNPSLTTATILSTIDVSGVTYNVTSIGNDVFAFNSSLRSVTIPDSVTSIGSGVFRACQALTSITIPNFVTSIGGGAFGQSGLYSLTIPSSVTSIVGNPCSECNNLTAISVNASNPNYSNDAFGVLFNKFKTTLITYPVANIQTSYTIPSSVTSIGSSAFGYNKYLTAVTIPTSVTSIESNAFISSELLTTITIPNSVTSIGGGAFYNCSKLGTINFLRTPTLPTIGVNAFLSIKSPNVANVYVGTDTAGISGLFTSIANVTLSTLTSITPFTSTKTLALVVISYANLVTNGNEVVNNTPYVFLVNEVSSGSLSIGATQGSATPWNASTNKTIDPSNNAYWTPSGGSGLANAFSVAIQDSLGAVSSPNVQVQVNVPYPCFLEGTQILCFENNTEAYRPIESLRKGDLVKTIYNGYTPIHMIGTTALYNPGNDYRVVNRLYKCSREKYPALFEDLYITGCHSILVPWMTPDQWENTKAVNGDVFVTDNHFRLIACADEKAEPFNAEGFMNIYHIALEHNDYYMNYGIYANGMLVESCSKRYLTELSNMRILGEADCPVSEDIGGVSNNMKCQLVDIY